MQKILLTGATGYVGSHLLPLLKNVRCMVRSPEKAKLDAEVVKGDVFDFPSLQEALKSIDVAFYLIHSMEIDKFEDLDRQAAENFGKAAEANGVKRIIYLGGLGEDLTQLSPHLRSRHEVGEVLRHSAPHVQVIEFRASIVIGAGSLSFEMVRALCERLPFMITPKWVWAKAQPIAIQDLLQYLVQAIDVAVEGNPIFEIGGKDQVSYAEIMKEYSEQRKMTRVMLPVPVITPYLSSLWLGLVTPLYANVGRKLIESACHPTIVTDRSGDQYFQVNPMGIKEAISLALDDEECGRLVDIKTETVNVSPEKTFAPIRRIGGKNGWYWGNGLWRLRGFVDLLFGGVGLRRGRVDPEELKEGDHLDFWTIEAYEPNHFLRLRAEMKVPGTAWLEFKITGDESQSTIEQRAIFHPRGLFGLIYWYGLYPLHSLVFSGMIRGIARIAQKP